MLAFLDYDGTLTTHECNEIVLQRFVGDAWRPLEAEAKADRMSHAECFDRQIGLIQAPRAELIGALDCVSKMAGGARVDTASLATQHVEYAQMAGVAEVLWAPAQDQVQRCTLPGISEDLNHFQRVYRGHVLWAASGIRGAV